MSAHVVLKTVTKQTPPKAWARGEKDFEIIIFNEPHLRELQKKSALPKSAWDDFKFSERETTKGLLIPNGLYEASLFLMIQNPIEPFFLQEGIRKAFPSDLKKFNRILLDTSRLSETDSKQVIDSVSSLVRLLTYTPKKFGKKIPTQIKAHEIELHIATSLKPSLVEETVFLAAAQSKATNLVRHLAELPGNELKTSHYLELIKNHAKEWGAEFKFLDQKELKKRKAGAFLAVVRANPNDPYGIIHLKYKPKKSSGKKIAIIGKGLCFDTGGYNIKTGDYMFDMHRDMTGSAVALGLFGLFVETSSEHEVHAYLALAENLISPTAYRPNDIVVASNGISIEVVDTDAEGRMVLSDTLVYACENNPDFMIDFATLTGCAVRSIDTKRSAVFSNNENLLEAVVAAGKTSGERVWPFPIGEDYFEGLHSDLADIRQCGPGHNADHIYAATFLSLFVKPEIPWVHVDLSCESNKGGLGLAPKDVTGFGVRLAYETVKQFKFKKSKT